MGHGSMDRNRGEWDLEWTANLSSGHLLAKLHCCKCKGIRLLEITEVISTASM